MTAPIADSSLLVHVPWKPVMYGDLALELVSGTGIGYSGRCAGRPISDSATSYRLFSSPATNRCSNAPLISMYCNIARVAR